FDNEAGLGQLVGGVKHQAAETASDQRSGGQMVAETARRSDDDLRARRVPARGTRARARNSTTRVAGPRPPLTGAAGLRVPRSGIASRLAWAQACHYSRRDFPTCKSTGGMECPRSMVTR